MNDEVQTIKVLLADDHKLVRDGIKGYLEEDAGIEVVAEAGNGEEALKLIAEKEIDIAILDINMPELDGIKTAEKIKERKPGVKIIALTMLKETQHIRQMLRAGASAYLLKSCSRNELLLAIKAAHAGDTYFSQEVTHSVMQAMSGQGKAQHSKFNQILLTKREKEILHLITLQYSNQDIAAKLFISVRTVEAHKRNLIEKTGSKNVVGLVLYAIEHGLQNSGV
ncbi:MAG: response regulator transcription factor [Saprospiraceae bacterium]|nr:MAG: response regulator transcription factor [Saprospiraceae bacterium]